MPMSIIDRLKAATGDSKSKISTFVGDLVHDLNLCVQASDIQKVRDIAAHLGEHREAVVTALSGTGPVVAKDDPAKEAAEDDKANRRPA